MSQRLDFIDPLALSEELKRKIEIKKERIKELSLALSRLENFEKIEAELSRSIKSQGQELSALLLKRFNHKEKIFTQALTQMLQTELERLKPKEEEGEDEGENKKKNK